MVAALLCKNQARSEALQNVSEFFVTPIALHSDFKQNLNAGQLQQHSSILGRFNGNISRSRAPRYQAKAEVK